MSVKEVILAEANSSTMDLMHDDLPRLEALLKECPRNHPERGAILRGLTLFYRQLNALTAAACKEIGYSLRQWEWDDSRPLTEISNAFPYLELETTNWFQWQLGMVMMPPQDPNHIWLTLFPRDDFEVENGAVSTNNRRDWET